MDEAKIQVLLDLLLLPVQDRPDLGNFDASFDRLALTGEVARLMDAEAELGEALKRKARLQNA